MAALIHGTSLDELCRKLGVHPQHLLEKRVDTSARGLEQLAQSLTRTDGARKHATDKDDTERCDAATAFVTSPLAATLDPVMRKGNHRYLFVPGRGEKKPILEMQQKVDLGQTSLEYPIITLTGEAMPIGAGGLSDLKIVDSYDDQHSQPVMLFGVRMRWDMFSMWRGKLLNRDPNRESNMAASLAMDNFLEYTGSFGNNQRKIPGFFNHGSCMTYALAKSFGDPTLTVSEAFTGLSIMHMVWHLANPDLMITGVAMPETHRLNLVNLFGGENDAAYTGINAWKQAKESFPWLDNLITDERLAGANADGGDMWQMWSDDSEDLYFEGAPGHQLYGPFETELTTDFIMINQTGGIVSRDPRRMLRIDFPA